MHETYTALRKEFLVEYDRANPITAGKAIMEWLDYLKSYILF